MDRIGVYLSYELNKDYIATTLCVNQEKPELMCAGKCYLKSQLEKIDQTTQEQSNVKSQLVFSVYILDQVEPLSFHRIFHSFSQRTIFRSIHWFSSQYCSSLFHPPRG